MFYDWYGRYQDGGIEALEDGKPRPQRVWNKIPDEIGAAIVNLALDEPDLSPRELAVNFTDTTASFVSEFEPLHLEISSRELHRGSTGWSSELFESARTCNSRDSLDIQPLPRLPLHHAL
jgi:hypothetical protein